MRLKYAVLMLPALVASILAGIGVSALIGPTGATAWAVVGAAVSGEEPPVASDQGDERGAGRASR